MAAQTRAEVQYEIYLGEDQKFELYEVTKDLDSALGIARRLSRRPDALVRVMHEAYDPERDETVERVVFDSSWRQPKRMSSDVAEHRTEPQLHPPDYEPERVPGLVVVFGGLSIAMALAAATMAVF